MSTTSMSADERAAMTQIGRLWWVWLLTGIAWVIISLVILDFSAASVKTVGVLIGIMFLMAGIQQFFIASVADGWKWLWALFGLVFVVAGIVALFNPTDAFLTLAKVLGFLFLLVGIFWLMEAFAIKDNNPLWWLTLIAGILMVLLAFWTHGQFLLERTYTLLIFAGIWALMAGVTDITKAFVIRRVGKMASH